MNLYIDFNLKWKRFSATVSFLRESGNDNCGQLILIVVLIFTTAVMGKDQGTREYYNSSGVTEYLDHTFGFLVKMPRIQPFSI